MYKVSAHEPCLEQIANGDTSCVLSVANMKMFNQLRHQFLQDACLDFQLRQEDGQGNQVHLTNHCQEEPNKGVTNRQIEGMQSHDWHSHTAAQGALYQINQKRLWEEIHKTSCFGLLSLKQGMNRLSLSMDDKLVRDYLCTEARSLGCQVRTDEMGNIFAIRPGRNNDIPPIGMGSHLDTQPAGGRFDGILGVLAGLEVLRTMKENDIQTYAPVAAINWTNEEGVRFTPGCTGSAVWASHIPLEVAHAMPDTSNTTTMKESLSSIGYLGETKASHKENPLSAHFELHIEQNRKLQDSQRRIGIVTKIQGIRWYRVQVLGRRDHAGATPMQERADALVATAKFISFLDRQALVTSAVATVGVLNLERPSLNTVPGWASFTMDIRHLSEATLEKFESAIDAMANLLKAENSGLDFQIERTWHSPAVDLDPAAIKCTQDAACDAIGASQLMEMVSFAGHDSALTAMAVPTSMIFVPSRDGISHAPAEFTSERDCGNGAQVLLGAVLNYDRRLESQKGTR